MTSEEAEAIRGRAGLKLEEFSKRLGYASPTAYRMAIKHESVSRLMTLEIRRRFRAYLKG